MITDRARLLHQYATSRNLSARADLHARYNTNPQGWHHWLWQQMRLEPCWTVLDLGCGPGRLWRNHTPDGSERSVRLLTDLSRGMVKEAKETLAPPYRFAVADAQSIPFRAHAFDCVTAHHMLYHVPDLHRACTEIARVLKPEGRLVAATNGAAHLRELHELVGAVMARYQMPIGSFGLDNGRDLLTHYFEEVTVRRYEDALVVPDPWALSGYVRSMPGLPDASEQELRELDHAIASRIRDRGTMRIRKEAGVLVARVRKPRDRADEPAAGASGPWAHLNMSPWDR